MKPCRERGCEERRKPASSLCYEHWRAKKARRVQRQHYRRVTQREEVPVKKDVSLLKIRTFMAYGVRCAYCGTNEVARLQLDHIENNGHTHRLLISGGRAGEDFYRALEKRGFPNEEPYKMEPVCDRCHVAVTTTRRYGASEEQLRHTSQKASEVPDVQERRIDSEAHSTPPREASSRGQGEEAARVPALQDTLDNVRSVEATLQGPRGDREESE
jgi:hypothetical protein